MKKNYIGNKTKNYDSFLVVAHFKGHGWGGFGGALKQLYGTYSFQTPDDFNRYYADYMDDGQVDPTQNYINYYRYGHANVDVTGDPRWEASFGAAQLGFYVQDKWDATPDFQLTYGLRMDIPIFFDTPAANVPFNEYAKTKGWDLRTDQKLSSTPLWSPRVGFRWDINGDRRFILRGGAGVFTGRIPFVWISNNFSNTGIQMSQYYLNKPKGINVILDPNGQEPNVASASATSGNETVNVYDKNFKFAQNLRFNLGFDFKALGIDWTAEAIYSKTLNDMIKKDF